MEKIEAVLRMALDHKMLLVVLLLAVIISVVYIESYKIEKIYGDEPDYIEITHLEASQQISPLVSLLPGFLHPSGLTIVLFGYPQQFL